MRRGWLSAFSAAALGVTLGCVPPPPERPGRDELIAAANALDLRLLAAMNAGDGEAVGSLYWDSAEFVAFAPDAAQPLGLSAARERVATLLGTLKGAKFEVMESHQIPVGEAVIGWALWRVTLPGPEGTTTVVRSTNVKAERNGRWVYLTEHTSVPLPPAGAPSP
jgi:ketosteroid isomerase-like protein